MYVNWKEGLRVEIHGENDNYNKFIIMVGDNDIPYAYGEITNGMFIHFDERFYIEYNIKMFECDEKNSQVKEKYSCKFNSKNENLYFELEPNNQTELDIWIDYLMKFADIKQCFLSIKRLNNFIYKSSDRISIVDEEINYYAKYKISWEDKLNYNPGGIQNIDSYTLINNCLLKL